MPRPFTTKSFVLNVSLALFALVLISGLWFFIGAGEAKYENCESVVSALEASIHDQFPGLNVGEAAHFKMHSLTPTSYGAMLVGFAMFAFVIPLILYITWRDDLSNKESAKRIDDEDRSAIYRQNPGAMRLAGASSYMSESFEPIRTIDPVYDVRTRRELGNQQSWLWKLVPALVFGGLAACFLFLPDYEIVESKRISELLIDWGPFLVVGWFGLVVAMAVYCMFAEPQGRRPEIKRKTSSLYAQSQKSVFYLYNELVLEELGFEKLETCLCTKYTLSSIYLSHTGNLLVELVEVGFGAGTPYFALATVTNDGKFLETNSSVKPKDERRDVNMRYQTRSANHGDIVRALQEHDRLVGEFTYGGSVQEAQFPEERYERFLRWGAEKNAV